MFHSIYRSCFKFVTETKPPAILILRVTYRLLINRIEMSSVLLPTKHLVVFDFDHTVIDCNSDTYIRLLAPNKRLPSELWDEYERTHDWTKYMQQAFIYLHQNDIRREHYEQLLVTMPLVESMNSLLTNLYNNGHKFEAIIISDSNTFFIDHFLRSLQLRQLFNEIITNRSHFDEDGCLRLCPCHHNQSCSLSPANMCKATLLREYIAKRANDGHQFETIHYIGDGRNDLCPALQVLTSRDRVYPRIGYALQTLIDQRITTNELSASVHPFTTGNDIWKILSDEK